MAYENFEIWTRESKNNNLYNLKQQLFVFPI
jgi:hypothetical protein